MAIHLYKTSTPSTRNGAVDSQVKSNPQNNLIYGQHYCGKSRNVRGIITARHRGGAGQIIVQTKLALLLLISKINTFIKKKEKKRRGGGGNLDFMIKNSFISVKRKKKKHS